FNRRLKEHEGWSDSLQAEFGHDVVGFLAESEILDEGAATLAAAKELLAGDEGGGDSFDTEIVSDSGSAIERPPLHRRSSIPPAELFPPNASRGLVESPPELLKQVGPPPFQLALGERSRSEDTFADLRAGVFELARQGVKLQRFKGLGEMNAEQLRETT